MPRIKRIVEESPRPASGSLAERLAEELRENRASGQPMIDEMVYPTGALRVIVIWDEWDRLSFDERSETILNAYDLAEGDGYRDKIALVNGLTVPEAHAAGMLPVQIIPALRKNDAVTADECRRAMIDEGASLLMRSDWPQLRFATSEQADAAVKRLIEHLPNSEEVWVITQEVGKVEEWARS